jgi:hypothetical protein
MDIQLLIGLGVWVLADWDRKDSFLFWIHPLLMLVAVGLAHAGRAMSERESDSRQKGTRASLFFGGSLVVVLVGIPLASWPI